MSFCRSAPLVQQSAIITPWSPMRSTSPAGGTSQTAYFVYMGTVVDKLCVNYIHLIRHANGVGSPSVEVGLFSTPLPPNGAGQTLTKIVSTTLSGLTSGAPLAARNTSALGQLVPAGTELWAGYRGDANGGTLPNFGTVTGDGALGAILQTASAGTFAGNASFAGVLNSLVASPTFESPWMALIR